MEVFDELNGFESNVLDAESELTVELVKGMFSEPTVGDRNEMIKMQTLARMVLSDYSRQCYARLG
jgi:hypothetical protein